ncbi:hypothetical protein [Pontiella desulfatans]|uniref:hypothetical protein n=1 Tax=Pontiella desulfatans TaxID=2750659 RepID=UPI0014440D76|nr:hypothetical protein [Pontiella desulfatans]
MTHHDFNREAERSELDTREFHGLEKFNAKNRNHLAREQRRADAIATNHKGDTPC